LNKRFISIYDFLNKKRLNQGESLYYIVPNFDMRQINKDKHK